MKVKLSYRDSKKKIAVRDLLLSNFNLTKIVGLGGPDIDRYIDRVQRKGFMNISIWEMNRHIMLIQLQKLMFYTNITYNFGDILNAPLRDDVLYDLDFCCHIETVKAHIEKFRSNFLVTVSERGKPKFSSIEQFICYRREQILCTDLINADQRIVTTEKGKYLFTTYYDTSLMLIINQL